MAQHLNADDAKNQGYLHHTPSSSKEPTQLTTESSQQITMMTPKPNEEILITPVRGFKDLPKVSRTSTSLRTEVEPLSSSSRLSSPWQSSPFEPLEYDFTPNVAHFHGGRSSSHAWYLDQDEVERDSNDKKRRYRRFEEENRAGICKTSGNQIFFDVEIGVSPPNSPTAPPRNEPKGLPKSISPKQVDPGSDSKINGCFSWRKRKRLRSTVHRL
ncbi:hypothetical protein MKX03_005432 [Papaver bracteatum]|nr:hypothetical protein MKX03_005432 [Papaver bracteatum]